MSKEPTVEQMEPKFDYFSPAFYQIWGDEPEIMRQAQAVNALAEELFAEYRVSQIWELPPEIQQTFHEKAWITIDLGERE